MLPAEATLLAGFYLALRILAPCFGVAVRVSQLILPNHLLFPCSANQTVRYNVRNGTKREMYAPTEICLPGVQTFRYASFSSYLRQGVRTLPLSLLPDINTESSATQTGMHTTGFYSLSLILQLHGYSV